MGPRARRDPGHADPITCSGASVWPLEEKCWIEALVGQRQLESDSGVEATRNVPSSSVARTNVARGTLSVPCGPNATEPVMVPVKSVLTSISPEALSIRRSNPDAVARSDEHLPGPTAWADPAGTALTSMGTNWHVALASVPTRAAGAVPMTLEA